LSQVNFTILNTKSKELQLVQANIQKSVVAVQQTPFSGGNYMTGIAITAGTPQVISHGLSRTPVIWVIGDQDTNTTIWRTAWTTSTITLNAGHDCTIAIWVN